MRMKKWESPPPPGNMIGDEYGDDCLACLPGPMGRKVKRFPRTFMFWALILQYLFCEATKQSVLPGLDWHWLLWNCAHGKQEPSPLIDFEESHHFANPGVRESCFAYLPWFCKVSLSSAMILLEFSFCWIWQW